jgi:hypothetical protein
MEKEFLTVRQLCKMFHLSPSSVYIRVASGRLPHIRIPCQSKNGRTQIRFDVEEVLSFFKKFGKELPELPFSSAPSPQDEVSAV